jgi:hypothetical protein
MSKPFDAMLNTLIDGHEYDWAGYFGARAGITPGIVTSLDTDLSSTLQADRLFRIDGPTPAVLHLELESTGKLGRPAQLLRYNVAAWGTTGLPVHSVLIVLRPKANASDLTGEYEVLAANGQPYLTFRYTVVRLWQESVESLLNAGPGIAPLALLTDEAEANLPAAFIRFKDRLRSDKVPDNVERVLLGSVFILCGLRYTLDRIVNLYRDMSMTLEDSTTYQFILNKGQAKEAQKLLLRFAEKRFGSTPSAAEAAILAISDLDRLERMADRVNEATNWEELLATV